MFTEFIISHNDSFKKLLSQKRAVLAISKGVANE
jgi:hypothetical protein